MVNSEFFLLKVILFVRIDDLMIEGVTILREI